MTCTCTNVLCSHSSLIHVELKNIINLELMNLVEWFRINKLPLNAEKSCYIIFLFPNKIRDDDGNNMDQVISSKFLGIYIAQHRTWAEHIKIISNKIAKNIGIIRKIAHPLPKKFLINLYYTLVNRYFLWEYIQLRF